MVECKILVDDIRDIIKNAIVGHASMNQEVGLFDFGNVLVQKNYFENEAVRIISCRFAEYVGKGMLTASVYGDDFFAPCSKTILRTIRELCLNHVKGVLIIVPASSGNLFNFGLATERALNDNLRVKLLAVSDDVANEIMPKTCKRGLSGVILVSKIAGAMAEMGKSLTEIYTFCQQVAKNLSSIGLSLKQYHLSDPTTHECTCIQTERKKTRRNSFELAQNISEKVLRQFVSSACCDEVAAGDQIVIEPDDNIVVLMNNSCGISKLEEMVFVKEFLTTFESMPAHVQRFYVGDFFKVSTRIDFTVTVMKVFDTQVLTYLDEPCNAPGWQRANQGLSEFLTLENTLSAKLRRKERLAPPIQGPKISDKSANVLLLSLQFACDALISCEKQLNLIDSENGDGDTGTRLKNASEVILKRIKTEKIVTNYPFTFFEGISKLLESTLGGTLGCIYSILFEAAAHSFKRFSEDADVTPMMWLEALQWATDALKRYGNINFGDNTMYDPLFNCAERAREELEKNIYFIDAFGRAVSAAEQLVLNLKRPHCKYPDSGAHAVGIWMRAVFEGVKLRCPLESSEK